MLAYNLAIRRRHRLHANGRQNEARKARLQRQLFHRAKPTHLSPGALLRIALAKVLSERQRAHTRELTHHKRTCACTQPRTETHPHCQLRMRRAHTYISANATAALHTTSVEGTHRHRHLVPRRSVVVRVRIATVRSARFVVTMHSLSSLFDRRAGWSSVAVTYCAALGCE